MAGGGKGSKTRRHGFLRGLVKVVLAAVAVLAIMVFLSGGHGAGDGGTTGTVETKTDPSVDESTEKVRKAMEALIDESSDAGFTYGEPVNLIYMIIRISGTDIYEDDEPVDVDQLATQLGDIQDGVSVILQDDYAEEDTYTSVRDLLDEYSVEFVEQQLD